MFLKIRKRFVWAPSEYEQKILDEAPIKIFKPTLDCLNKLAEGGRFSTELEYYELNGNGKRKNVFPIDIVNRETAGLPFRINLPDSLVVRGVKYKESYNLSNELIIKRGTEKFIVAPNSVTDFKSSFPKRPNYLEGSFSNFRSTNNSENEEYFRLVVPTRDVDMLYPTAILDYGNNQMKFDISSWDRQMSLMGIPFLSTKGMFSELKINGKNFHFYGIEAMNSYIIDSTQKITKSEFVNVSRAIRTCLGFLLGRFYQQEAIYLSSPDQNFLRINNFDYRVEEPSIISENQIINHTFFFGKFSAEKESIQQVWSQHHNMFPCEVFSKLCEKFIDSQEFARSIHLVINAGSIKEPIQKGALYSVAIETLTEYFKSTSEESSKPIQEKEVSKELIKSLISVLENFKQVVDSEGYEVLVTKLQNINSPTNLGKLTKPFESVGIDLTTAEIETLKQRNQYLHGNKPLSSEDNLDLLKIALQLHSLIGRLVLKHVGYTGHYIHLPAWYLLRDRNTKNLIERFDVNELKDLYEKMQGDDLEDIPDKTKAAQIINEFKSFIKAAEDLKDVVMII